MKRVRWNGELQWDDGEGGVLRSDPTGLLETDYRGFAWREVEGTEYVPETGEIRLVLKPEPMAQTLKEAAKDFERAFGLACPKELSPEPESVGYRRCFQSWVRLQEAIAREEDNPANPPENNGRIPQQLLDAIDPSAVSGGTRAVLLVSDGGWAVKDFPFGVDTGKVELWCGPSVLESRCSHDRVKPKEAAQ